MRTIFKILPAMLALSLSLQSVAGVDPVSTAGDSRVRVVAYSPTNITQIVTYTGIGTTIQIDPSEAYETFSSGAVGAITVSELNGGRLVIKPTISEADTNLTIYTNRRTYLFEVKIRDPSKLENGYTNDVRDANLTFMLYFQYPEEEARLSSMRAQQRRAQEQARCENQPGVDPAKLNFNYAMSGSGKIAPLAVYDDGVFTYFQFHEQSSIPAIYGVDQGRNETAMNSRMEGRNLVVIEQIADRFTLRNGEDVVTVLHAESVSPAKRAASLEKQYADW